MNFVFKTSYQRKRPFLTNAEILIWRCFYCIQSLTNMLIALKAFCWWLYQRGNTHFDKCDMAIYWLGYYEKWKISMFNIATVFRLIGRRSISWIFLKSPITTDNYPSSLLPPVVLFYYLFYRSVLTPRQPFE